MIKGAIFDMDGTLTDTERVFRDTWLSLAGEYGQEAKIEFTQAVCGSNGQEQLNIITRFYPDIDAAIFSKDCYARVHAITEKEVPLKEGAREILAYFKGRGIKLAIASSSSHDQIEKNMRKAGLLEYFDAFVGGDEVENSKPQPDVFLKAAKAIGCKPEECYAFEDGMNGLKSGLAAGCKVFMIVDLTMPDDVVAPQCTGVYDSLLEAMEAIKERES